MSRSEGKAFLQLVVVDGEEKKPACATVEPELFFPSYTIGGDGERTEELAKSVCRRCPITSACLEFALHTGDKWAILGGMRPDERAALKQKMSGLKAA